MQTVQSFLQVQGQPVPTNRDGDVTSGTVMEQMATRVQLGMDIS